jgi:2-amino-4-hydroxy-6-hydroxymethyldihydropteridine diphosphokinase
MPKPITGVFISVGSNLGDRAANCREAIRRLSAPGAPVRVVKASALYETEPWGVVAQPSFVNAAIELATALSPAGLLGFLKSIESAMGRTVGERRGPRVIDLDIIFYGDAIVDEDGLKIPHPLAHKRSFVLTPLAEIAPDFIHPVIGKKVSDIALIHAQEALGTTEGVKRLGRVPD